MSQDKPEEATTQIPIPPRFRVADEAMEMLQQMHNHVPTCKQCQATELWQRDQWCAAHKKYNDSFQRLYRRWEELYPARAYSHSRV